MITVDKKVISELTLCYCVSLLQYQGKRHLVVASEKQYACLLFDEQGIQLDTIWEGPGGTMSAVQFPGVDGAFLATHRFFSPNNSKEASIVLCWHENGQWRIKTLMDLPCIHRFGILHRNGVHYLLACTIKEDYEYMDDWRLPGKVYAAVLPEDLFFKPDSFRLEPTIIHPALYKNHGFSICAGGESALVSAQEGVFKITPPETAVLGDDLGKDPLAAGNGWSIEHLVDEPSSEALLTDLDGDGVDELVTFSPFHGDRLKVFKPDLSASSGTESNENDPGAKANYVPVFTYEGHIDFAHALCAATLEGKDGQEKQLAIIGHRKGNRDLLALYWKESGYCVDILDHDIGPANVLSFNVGKETFVLSANREINEVALYHLKEMN